MLEFAPSRPFTLGVEVELQIVDRTTLELSPKATTLLDRWQGGKKVQPEFFQSMIEVNTGICETAVEAEADLRATMRELIELGRAEGVRFIATGTHPTARYGDRIPFPADRYHGLIARNQWIARRLLIFGLHVHLGMPSAERCIAVQNELLWDLGLLLACSTSSPYWQGKVTGLASSRITVFEAMPTGGMPALVADWAEFTALVDALQKSKAITSLKDLWWDIRPSPKYGTLEIRVCDGLATVTETAMIVALAQALARRANARVEAGTARSHPPAWLVRENKWRASRHGMGADFVLDETGTTEAARPYLARTLDELAQDGHFAGSEKFLPLLRKLTQGAPTSAERQIAVYERTQSFPAVIESVAEEFERDALNGGLPT